MIREPLRAPESASNANGQFTAGAVLLTAEQLAERWQVPKSHVYRLARKGELPCVRLGRYRRFHLGQVERWELDADRNGE